MGTGFDKAVAPTAAVITDIARKLGAHWVNVYMGGPASAGEGWTPQLVQEVKALGVVDSVLLTYVPEQVWGPGAGSLGRSEGAAAVALARSYGATSGAIIANIEGGPARGSFATGDHVTEFVQGFCDEVNALGFEGWAYSNVDVLRHFHDRLGEAIVRGVWAASWVRHDVAAYSPEGTLGVAPHDLTPTMWQGRRAWQYAGTFGGVNCAVDGVLIDIDVADGTALHAIGAHPAPGPAPAPAPAPTSGDTYTVVPGDTLSLVAMRAGLSSWQSLYGLNAAVIEDAAHHHGMASSENGHYIFPGTLLRLHSGVPAPAPPKTYVVQSGDTLSLIAMREGLHDWRAIYARNAGAIEGAARQNGHPNSNGGNLIFPGTVLAV